MKKYFAILLAAIILLSFVACSGNGGGQTANVTAEPTEAPTETPTETPTEAPTEEPDPIQLSFGDAIETEMFKFTPSFDGFAKEVANWPDENYLTPNGKIAGINPFKAANGKVMMYFSGMVEYIGNSKQNETFTIQYIVDYDDGYVFDGNNDYNATAFQSEEARYHTAWANSADKKDWDHDNKMTFAPLSSVTKRFVRFAIEVPEALKSATDKPLKVVFSIEGVEYCFIIR